MGISSSHSDFKLFSIGFSILHIPEILLMKMVLFQQYFYFSCIYYWFFGRAQFSCCTSTSISVESGILKKVMLPCHAGIVQTNLFLSIENFPRLYWKSCLLMLTLDYFASCTCTVLVIWPDGVRWFLD